MKRPYKHGLVVLLFSFLTACNGQTHQISTSEKKSDKKEIVGGGCDGCELMYVGMPSKIRSIDTCIDWKEQGQKLILSGLVYKHNGKTPASGIIIYYYHTDNTGHYTKRNDHSENQTIHGYIRGWVKTDSLGRYSIYTLRPAAYP